MSTSKSQAEIDFENASDEDIINPKGATRPRAAAPPSIAMKVRRLIQ